MSAFSIKLFLADGRPDGLRLAEKSNWTGLAIVCSRSQYPLVRGRDEFQRAGVYVLVGRGESVLPRVYVGEADVLRKRLDNHLQTNEFWDRLVAFTSKDGTLNKAHVRYLEARLIAIAKEAKRAELGNATASQSCALSPVLMGEKDRRTPAVRPVGMPTMLPAQGAGCSWGNFFRPFSCSRGKFSNYPADDYRWEPRGAAPR